MIKSIIVFLALFVGVFASVVSADETVYNKSAYCLNADRCFGGSCGGDDTHRLRLSSPSEASKKAPPNKSKLFLTECLHIFPTKASFEAKTPTIICTTGNPELDAELFCGPIKSASDLQQKVQSENCNQLLRLGDNKTTWYDFADRPGSSQYGILQELNIHYTLEYRFGGDMNNNADPYRAQHHAPVGSYGMFYQTNGSFIRNNPTVTIHSDGAGNIVPNPIYWQSYTLWTIAREFLIWNVEPVVVSGGTGGADQGGIGGQQQATLSFPVEDIVNSQACTPVAFDPYGRVFDAKSLEPIPRATVELRQLNPLSTAANSDDRFELGYALQQNVGVPNPYGTNEAGHFEFYVGDGTYRLFPSAQGYDPMPQSESSKIPSTFSQIYKNIYYTNSPPIVQVGKIEQRDIPMVPRDGIGKEYPAQLIWDTQEQQNGKIAYRGRVSHPFAKIVISKCHMEGTVEICSIAHEYSATQGGPDRIGDFEILLDQSSLTFGEYFRVSDIKKTVLTQSPLVSIVNKLIGAIKPKMVFAEVAQIHRKIDPIPTYLEGYVYDASGTLLPHGLVEIYIDYSPTPVYTTRADETGRFIITSEYIPASKYWLVFAGDTNPLQETTSQFLESSAEFLAAENINPYLKVTSQTNPRRSVTPVFIPQQKISAVPGIPQPSQNVPNVSPTEDSKGTNNPLYLVGAILLLLIGGAGALIALHMYRKRSTE